MQVTKRDGSLEPVSFDKIQSRLAKLCQDLDHVNLIHVCKRVIQGLHDGVKTSDLDTLAAETAASLASEHTHYSILAARISMSNLHKMTVGSISAVFDDLDPDVLKFCKEHQELIDSHFKWEADFKYDYFGFKTLEKSYLLKHESGMVKERPQVMLMRVAVGVHTGDIGKALFAYSRLSDGCWTPATPILFNAGTVRSHLASCFLLPVVEDSIEGIFETISKCAHISKSAGGIGFSVSNVRAEGSLIKTTKGRSSGILPMLKCFEQTARYVDQGGGKRQGAFAAYLEPWHADVQTFLSMKKNHGSEELRARDLFYALWIPDLFMKRVESNGVWTLFCPTEAPGLVDLHGAAFEEKYLQYEAEQLGKTIQAQTLWFEILDAQIESGVPFLLYKDACNAKSNHQHLGTIRSSNLCTEIVQYSSASEIAVCNLASLALPKYVCCQTKTFDHKAFFEAVHQVVEFVNAGIDRNHYAREEAKRSNVAHRPMGIGVQGLADVFAMMELDYEGPGARALNFEIFETLYYAAVDKSVELARKDGPYDTFDGSPASRGILQYDMWDSASKLTSRWDWDRLKRDLKSYGMRNSLLIAPMPTASTAQILGNNEAFEPFTSNVYVRRVLSGEFVLVNKHLVFALEKRGLWNLKIRQKIIASEGSVQNIPEIPDDLKRVFKTVWEMKMRSLIDLAADRAIFVDQSQSLNLWMKDPTHKKLSSMHFYAWKKGLKTGMYYLRTKAATEAIKTAIPVEVQKECLMCSA